MNYAFTPHAISCLAVTLSAQDIQKEAWDRVPPYADSLFKTHLDFNNDAAWTLRLGGHARTMLEAYRNPDFGFSEIKQDAWVHHRVQTFAAVERGRNFTLAAEVTWGEMEGRKPPLSPVDEDQLDLLQLYAQARFDIGDAELALRAGRQALYYGSGRLLAVREGANQRLSQDALRLSWRQDDWNVDGILASPVKIQSDAFDNTSQFDQTMLWGLYATGPSIFGKGHGVDFYYLGLRQENAPLSPGMTEQRHTFGSRWFGKTQNWNYNHEFILQTGDSGGKDILAGAVSLSAGRSFKSAPLKPTLGFKADVISGGQNGMSMHTFNPLFQANNYFNEGGFVSPSNLWNLNPTLDLELYPTLSLKIGVNFLWRYDTNDSVYAPPLTAVAGAAPNGERYLGTAYNVALSWEPHPSFDLNVGITHHEAGSSITSLGGGNVDYLQVAARIEF